MMNENRFPDIAARDRACLVVQRRSRARRELVEFPNLADHAPSKLLGYLPRPDAGMSAMLGDHADRAAPYPAVVVLHGCSGISSHSAKIADRLGSWRYVALTVDSLGSRLHGRWLMAAGGPISVIWGILLFIWPAVGALVMT